MPKAAFIMAEALASIGHLAKSLVSSLHLNGDFMMKNADFMDVLMVIDL